MVIGIVLLIVVLSGAGVAVFVAWRLNQAIQAQWTPLQGEIKFTYNAGSVVPEVLIIAVDNAVDLISSKGPWPRASVVKALRGVRINVMPQDKWAELVWKSDGCHPSGREVAGQTWVDNNTVQVGAHLGALTHEFCHICEWQLDHVVDYTHAGWKAKGIVFDGE